MTSRRRPPAGAAQPPQLDQKMSESSAPKAPTASRIQPIVCRLKPLVETCTANASTAPTAIRMMLTPIPIRATPFDWSTEASSLCAGKKRGNSSFGYDPRGAPGAPRLPLSADARPRARDPRQGGGVSARAPDAHADDGLLAPEPVRGVPRGAVRTKQARLRPVAAHEVGLELRACPASRRVRAEDPPPAEDALRQRGGGAHSGSDPARRDLSSARSGSGLGARSRPPRGCRPLDEG